MKFTIDAELFARTLSVVSRAIPKKSTDPKFEAVEITAKENTLLLRGTDCQTMELQVNVPAVVQETGSVLLSAQRLTSFATKLPEGDVNIILTDNQVELKYGRNSKTALTVIEAEPLARMEEKTETLLETKVKAEALSSALQKVIPSVSPSFPANPVFEGILFETAGDGKITLVATDSTRMAVATIEGDAGEFAFVLPGATAKELLRLLPKGQEATVEIAIGTSIVSFKVEDVILSSLLIEGNFPAYKKVIPQEFSATLTVDRKDLKDSLERCALLSPQRLRLEIVDGKIHIQGESNMGVANEVVPILEQNGNTDLRIAFNPGFLLNGVISIGGVEVVELNVISPNAPLVITDASSSDLQLILPIRMQAAA